MRTRRLGDSDLNVSAVGIGTWVLGGDHWGNIKENESISAIHKAIDSGINLIDTAPAYGIGRAEEIVGKAIKGRREKVVISTKCGVHRSGKSFSFVLKPDEIRKELEDSLRRLNVDVIDLYQCHWPDPDTPIEDTMGEMLRIQKEGKIRYIGVSNFGTELLEKARALAPLVSTQPQYSLLDRKIEQDVLPYCRNHNMGVLAYGSLGSGILTGKYTSPPKFDSGDARSFFYPFYKEPTFSKVMELVGEMKKIADSHGKLLAHVAINWVAQQVGITSALVGIRTVDQAITNADTMSWELTLDDFYGIESAYKRIFGETLSASADGFGAN